MVDSHAMTFNQALALYNAGKFQQAIDYLLQEVKSYDKGSSQDHARYYNLVAMSYYLLGQLAQANKYIIMATQLDPDNDSYLTNYALILFSQQALAEAEKIALKAYELNQDSIHTINLLTEIYTAAQKYAKAKKFGLLSLNYKDQLACSKQNIAALLQGLGKNNDKLPIINNPIPAFNCHTPERNVIAYSLWGRDEKYMYTALLNALLMPAIYPGWTCRYYLDKTVPQSLIDTLKAAKVQVILKEAPATYYERLFWRFEVIDDPNIDFFLIRDADNVNNTQERVAVDEWLSAGKHFHIMRGYYSHAELILAGLWGGVANAIPNFRALVQQYFQQTVSFDRTCDQHFLRMYIWPLIKDYHLAHDAIYHFGTAKSFPSYGRFPDEIGQMSFPLSLLKKMIR